MAELNPKQRKVIEAYVKYQCNHTEAALKAGYKKSSAHTMGNRIINSPAGKDYARELTKGAVEKTKVTLASIIEWMGEVLQADYTEFLGMPEDKIKSLPIEMRRLVTVPDLRSGKFSGKLFAKEEAVKTLVNILSKLEEKDEEKEPREIKVTVVRPKKNGDN